MRHLDLCRQCVISFYFLAQHNTVKFDIYREALHISVNFQHLIVTSDPIDSNYDLLPRSRTKFGSVVFSVTGPVV